MFKFTEPYYHLKSSYTVVTALGRNLTNKPIHNARYCDFQAIIRIEKYVHLRKNIDLYVHISAKIVSF